MALTSAAGAHEAPSSTLADRFVPVLIFAPLLALGFGLTGVFLYFAVTSLPTRWPITYPEGAHVAAILRLHEGHALYPEFLAYPPLIAPYPPVLYWLGALLSAPFGLDAYATTVLTRVVVLVTSVAAAVCVVLGSRREGTGWVPALVGGLLALPIPLMDHWAFAVRPDLPAIALSMAAATLLVGNPGRIRWAGALAGLAFLTKLTAVSLPLAALVWLLGSRRWRDAVTFTLAASVVAGLGGGFALISSGGQAFNHTVVAHLNPPLSMEHALGMFARLPALAWFPGGLAILGVLLRTVRRTAGLGVIYWLISLAVALFTLRGRGGDVNYLLESAFVTCWLAAVGLHALWNGRSRGLRALAIGIPIMAGGLLWGGQTLESWRREGGVGTDRQLPIAEIQAAENVLAEEPTMVLLAGKPLIVSDPFHLSMLQAAGRYDPVDLVQRIRQREFGLIVLRGDARQTRSINGLPKWPEPVRRAIAEFYQVSKRVDLYWLYVPDRPRQTR